MAPQISVNFLFGAKLAVQKISKLANFLYIYKFKYKNIGRFGHF